MGTDLLYTYDLDSGELRDSRLKDVIHAALTADACEHIDFVASFAFPKETPAPIGFVAEFLAVLENTGKPIYFTAADRKDLVFILEMAAAVAGGEDRLREKPFIIHYAEPISPLTHSAEAVDKLLLCADKGIPLNYVPALMAGGTGPVTLAGAIVQANAEALSGLVMQQLRAPGAPMISGFSATPLDMRYGTTVYGSPDERLTHAACADLYHYYGLPVWGEAGCSDAKCLDEQAAAESALSILMAALDGTNLVHNVGYLGQGLIGHLGAVVMGNEIIGYAKRIVKGFDIEKNQLALETIRRVGPGGHFLAQKHTARFFRQELWQPGVFDRRNLDGWKANGAPPLRKVLTQRAREILRTHRPQKLPDPILKNLGAIMRRAQTELDGSDLGQ
jgi:trimethylamine--corrinoid protein Co-methyltransferase